MIDSTTACDNPMPPNAGWRAGRRSATRRAILTAIIATISLPALAADGPPAPDTLDPGAIHTRLVVIRSAKQGPDRPVVALANPKGTDDPAQIYGAVQGILARELFRQALLIAARDELGVATRDEVLGDAPSAVAEGGPHAELVTVLPYKPEKPSLVLIRRTDGADPETLLKFDLSATEPELGEISRIVEAVEALSRTEFPAALRKLGLEGKPNALRGDAGLPVGVEDRLAHLGYTEPFAAVRALHEAIRTDGESAARLGALVRGYALLGILSENFWHPAHKAFKARALLYAQRMVARDPKGSTARWHRAYAESLLGLHRDALADIVRAREQAKAAGEPFRPNWAELIEAYAGSDLVRMTAPQGPLAPLAALLRLLTLEPTDLTDLALLAAKDVLALEPECYRAHDAMCRFGGVSNLHQATTAGPAILARALPERLRDPSTGSPRPRERLDKPATDEMGLYGSLTRAGGPGADTGEPSWAVLGQLLRETRFLQVYRRLHFLRWGLMVPLDAFWTESAPVVVNHPYRPYLEYLASPPEKANRALDDLIEHCDMSNVQYTAHNMTSAMDQSKHPRAKVAWAFALEHADYTAHDLGDLVHLATGADQLRTVQSLLEVSPKSHYARAVIIEKDWPRARPHFAEWSKDADHSPILLAALGKRYSALGQVDEARRVLLRYITFSPDHWAYERLAKNYKERGELDRWQATLDEYLAKTEDHGLTHAEVRVEIANHFMELRQWDKAWPYAEAAAETWAEWAMLCASRCAEGRRGWEQAELWIRRATERYSGNSWARWLQFCKRTGHGDAESARAFTEHYLQSIGDRREIAADWAIGYFYWLTGDFPKAMSSFRKEFDANPDLTNCLNLILIADELGDAAALDEWIQTFLTRYPGQAPKTARIYQIFLQATARGHLEPADVNEVEKILDDALGAPPRQSEMDFFAGCYFKNHGKIAEARRHLELTVKSPFPREWVRAIAAESLRRLGVDVQALHAGPDGGK